MDSPETIPVILIRMGAISRLCALGEDLGSQTFRKGWAWGCDTSEIVTGQTGDAPVPIFLFDTPSPPCLERRDMCQEKGGPKP